MVHKKDPNIPTAIIRSWIRDKLFNASKKVNMVAKIKKETDSGSQSTTREIKGGTDDEPSNKDSTTTLELND